MAPKPALYARSVEIVAPIDRVYDFHLDTRNAPAISPAGARFLAIEGEFPVTDGSRVLLRVRQPPIPTAQTWIIRIGPLIPNRLIVDIAERSPFAYWRHEHRFEVIGPERTLMTDHIEYRLPGGPVGRIADRLFARRQLETIFAERHRRTREVLEGAS